MKNLISNRWYILWIVSIISTFFSVGTVNAQNPKQNKLLITNKAQSFLDTDTNKDGFISKKEYQFGSLDEFDVDKNGKLSRNEYQNANRALNRNTIGNTRSGLNRNNANCLVAQKGNGMGQCTKQGNGKNRGVGACPNGYQCPINSNNTKTSRQSTP